MGRQDALLAEAATGGLPDDVDVVCYFLSRRAADADSNQFLAVVVPQLAYLCDRDPPAATTHEFRALWQYASQTIGPPNRIGICC